MPLTSLDGPILLEFFCAVLNITGLPPQPMDATLQQRQRNDPKQDQSTVAGLGQQQQQLPKGVVLGPDGKPCRTCTSSASWQAMMKSATSRTAPSFSTAIAPQQQQHQAATTPTFDTSTSDCPPDVDELGRSTWTLLHSMTANYPTSPSPTQQQETKQFLRLFGKMYPCWVCADDFRAWMQDGNEPRVSNRDEFGRWMCAAHNAVNEKLGKRVFDCELWEQRWRTGWKDGRCD